jgi:hypothetical protein
MKGSIVDADLWHSFSQHIAIKDANHIYVLEESEGSRCTTLTHKTKNDVEGDKIAVFRYGGERTSGWAIATCATAEGIACSSSNVLAVGSSIDQSKYGDASVGNKYGVYLTVTPMGKFSEAATKVKWITPKNAEGGHAGVHLTKINDNRFMISWETWAEEKSLAKSTDLDAMSKHVLHYVFVDGNGNVVSKEFKAAAAISQCEPVVKDGKVVFFASDNASVAFYTINPTNGAFSKAKVYLVAGPNATWTYSKGVLRIKGKGAVRDSLIGDSEGTVKEKTTRVVVGSGITSIGASSFAHMKSLKQVRLPRGLKTIGKAALYGNSNLREVYIPKSVKSIGEKVVDTGYYWVGSNSPVRYAVIYCEKNSYAHKYAKKNKLTYVLASVKTKSKKVVCTGKAVKSPKATAVATQGKLSFTYYTDSACKKKTTKRVGAARAGAAPINPGTYYFKAKAAADATFGKIKSGKAKLVIVNNAKNPVKSSNVKAVTVKKGLYVKHAKSKGVYKITAVTKKGGKVKGGKVEFVAPMKKASSASIPATLKIAGATFKVASTGKNASKGATSLTSAAIGA